MRRAGYHALPKTIRRHGNKGAGAIVMPEGERTAVGVLDKLLAEGFRVSKASVCRWAHEWARVVHEVADLVNGEPPVTLPTTLAPLDPAKDPSFPPELRGVLPARLLHIARGAGVDAVEDATRALSEAVREQATTIAKAGDKRLRTVVAALGVMAGVVEHFSWFDFTLGMR
jgi:hypothetical protein